MSKSVAVIGSGYVGTVVAAALADLGRDVVVLETDAAKRRQLALGRPPFYEPGLKALVRHGVSTGRLRFTSNMAETLAESQVAFICVGSPVGPDGHADMSAVRTVAHDIGRNLIKPLVVVTKSTVPIGSGHWLASQVEDVYEGVDPVHELLAVVSCPEFLREGRAINDFLHPERIVLGSDRPAAIDAVIEVYRPILEQDFAGGDHTRRPVLVRTGLGTAEAVKYAANAFLATKISFINEISNICESVDADITDLSRAIGLDSRIGSSFLDAGAGWGGSCFGKDLSELISAATDHGHEPSLLRATVEVNRRQRRVVVDKLRRHLHTLQGRRICLLGLAFKPCTDDLRDAPALEIAAMLVRAGAIVAAHDPIVHEVPEIPELRVAADVLSAAKQADALVLLTEWAEFASLDLLRLASVMRGRLLVDGRNLLAPAAVTALGFVYEGIGRRTTAPPTVSAIVDESGESRPVRNLVRTGAWS